MVFQVWPCVQAARPTFNTYQTSALDSFSASHCATLAADKSTAPLGALRISKTYTKQAFQNHGPSTTEQSQARFQ